MKRAMEGLPNHDYTEWIDTYASTWMDVCKVPEPELFA